MMHDVEILSSADLYGRNAATGCRCSCSATSAVRLVVV